MSKPRIAVLGSRGMLGWMMEFTLWSSPHFDVTAFNRDNFEVTLGSDDYYNLHAVLESNFDYVVNCIGAIKPMFKDPKKTPLNVKINSIFPWTLAQWGEDTNTKIIHVTTDCVFDGLDGGYTESSPHNATDEYGKSKSLGEPFNCMVLRTSIIGPEKKGRSRSLVEWLRSNDGGQVNGFTNHLWNGVTTRELSRIVGQIINKDMYAEGTHHIFSNDVNKYELLKAMISAWGLNIEVEPVEATQYCNRTLRTERHLNSLVKPNLIGEQLRRLDFCIK